MQLITWTTTLYQTGIRLLCVAQNPANGFPARLLGLPFAYMGQAFLANDDEVSFDVHDVTVLWDGQPRHIKADATGSTPLVGMALLDSHSLYAEVEDRGRVIIERR